MKHEELIIFKLDQVLEDMSKMKEDMSEMKEDQAKNTADIAHHIRRSDLAEENIELLRKSDSDIREELVSELKPIKSHISFVKGAIWALGIVGAIVIGMNELGILEKLFS